MATSKRKKRARERDEQDARAALAVMDRMFEERAAGLDARLAEVAEREHVAMATSETSATSTASTRPLPGRDDLGRFTTAALEPARVIDVANMDLAAYIRLRDQWPPGRATAQDRWS
jgi:hypothetical protein